MVKSKGGKRKVAMLLAALDTTTASELLKGQPKEVVQEIAVELSHLDATGQAQADDIGKVINEFYADLKKASTGGIHIKSFVDSMLKGSVGKENAVRLIDNVVLMG